MFKSYSHQSVGLRKNKSLLAIKPNTSLLMGPDKYQNWKFFNPNAVLINSQALNNPEPKPQAVLSPIKSNKLLTTYTNIQQSLPSTMHLQQSVLSNTLEQPRRRRKMKGSFVDHILEAAQQTQDEENKDFFLTHVQTESILPPIKLGDNRQYKNLMVKQKSVPYLVSKHVRLASERLKYGKVENNHYQHYEKLEPIESVIAKVKPSEYTLNYKPKIESLQKPSLELMKTVNKQLQGERDANGGDPITQELIQDTYQTFGMNKEDIEDVDAIIAEEGDKINFDSKEIKFTEHQYEFKTICSKVNKDKSAEIFIKTNKDFSKWNLKDKNQQTYFLSRAASKEPKNFIQKEIEEKKQKDEEYLFRKPVSIAKAQNLHRDGNDIDEEDEYDSEGYEYYTETDRGQSAKNQVDLNELSHRIKVETLSGDAANVEDRGSLLSANEERVKHPSLSVVQNKNRKKKSNSSKKSKGTYMSKLEQQLEREEEERKQMELQLKEEEEMKKFIFLEKLKYEKAIKGYDKMPGLKANLDEFTDVLMHKLFKKREPTNEFKYILKKDNTHQRVDHTKPLYMDDLKRFQKLNQVGPQRQLDIIQHNPEDIKRNFQDINIFNSDLDQEFQESSSNMPHKKSKTSLKVHNKSRAQDKKTKTYTSAWYLPVNQWGSSNAKNSSDSKDRLNYSQSSERPEIGELTKQALKLILEPYKEGSAKKIKLFNKDDVEEEEQ